MLDRWIYGSWKKPFPMMDAAGDGGAGGNGSEGSSVEVNQGVSFDDFLKDPKNQAEFDRRVNKSLETAKSKWETEKQTAIDDAKKEAEKLAKMNAEQRAEHERQKREADFAKRERELTTRELKAGALEILTQKGIPKELAEVLNYESAETCNASIAAVEKSFQQAVEASVNEKLRGTPPTAGGTPPDIADAKLRSAFGLK